jgi:hypothetical protein
LRKFDPVTSRLPPEVRKADGESLSTGNGPSLVVDHPYDLHLEAVVKCPEKILDRCILCIRKN